MLRLFIYMLSIESFPAIEDLCWHDVDFCWQAPKIMSRKIYKIIPIVAPLSGVAGSVEGGEEARGIH